MLCARVCTCPSPNNSYNLILPPLGQKAERNPVNTRVQFATASNSIYLRIKRSDRPLILTQDWSDPVVAGNTLSYPPTQSC